MGNLTLIRHGQASFGEKDYDNLSDLGRKQGNLLGEYLNRQDVTFDQFFCGDLKRQVATMQAINNNYNPEILIGLNEYEAETLIESYFSGDIPFEIFQDKKKYFRIMRLALQKWQNNELKGLKNCWYDFRHQVLGSLRYMTKNTECNTLAVTSGGPISLILSEIFKSAPSTMIDLNLQIKNTSITKIVVTKKRLYLSEFNSTPHLVNSNAKMITYS